MGHADRDEIEWKRKMMEAATSIPDDWIVGCRALRETLAGRLDARTTVAARHLVWSLLQCLRRSRALHEFHAEVAGAVLWRWMVRPFCADRETARQIVLAAFAARLLELLRGRNFEALDQVPRALLSEFIVGEI